MEQPMTVHHRTISIEARAPIFGHNPIMVEAADDLYWQGVVAT
jgi:hypothetical protein